MVGFCHADAGNNELLIGHLKAGGGGGGGGFAFVGCLRAVSGLNSPRLDAISLVLSHLYEI